MAKVTMLAPEGVSSMSIGGVSIDIVEGSALVDEQFVDEARSHGFKLEGGEVVSGSRAELIQMFVTPARAVAEAATDDQLRDFHAMSDEDRGKFFAGMLDGIKKFPSMMAEAKAKEPAKTETKEPAKTETKEPAKTETKEPAKTDATKTDATKTDGAK